MLSVLGREAGLPVPGAVASPALQPRELPALGAELVGAASLRGESPN